MKRSYNILFLLFFLLTLTNNGFSQVRRWLYLADNAIFSCEYEKAKSYYLKVLRKKPDSYKANFGMALLLSDAMENYEFCLPYLQNALQLNPKKDTAPELMFALGRTYQYLGKFDSAIYFFQKMKRYDDLDDPFFEVELDKDLKDCHYAIKHTDLVSAKKLFVVNAGKTINSKMPEYVPVLTGNDQLIFTSKRKDDDKEKINLYNGQYFESMYVSDIHNGRTSRPRMFTIPKSYLMSKLSSSDESVISAIPDSKRIYLYRNGKIYEGDLTASIERPKKLEKIVNFDYYQNHATVSKDGQTLYFTSESNEGLGGNDIYKCVKQKDGKWGDRQNLGPVINTVFDEESPFIADDNKTLYFSSKGHDSYGGFDIYKSVYEHGKWSKPENLGLPINSTANDIFFIINPAGTTAYFSSSRAGGMGDLDIYKINYTEKYPFDCNNIDANKLAIDATSKLGDRNKFNLSATIPENMKDKVIHFNWLVNDSIVSQDEENFEYNFNELGNYTVKAKLMAWCDTCINPYVACAEKNIKIDVLEEYNLNASNKLNNESFKYMNDSIALIEGLKYYSTNLKEVHGELTKAQAAKLGLYPQPVYFDFNRSDITAESMKAIERTEKFMNNYPDLTISVVGHTDSRGSKKYNQILSERRALSIKNYFIRHGFDKTKINSSGKGEDELVNKCSDDVVCDESLHQQNRRVEIKLTKK